MHFFVVNDEEYYKINNMKYVPIVIESKCFYFCRPTIEDWINNYRI